VTRDAYLADPSELVLQVLDRTVLAVEHILELARNDRERGRVQVTCRQDLVGWGCQK